MSASRNTGGHTRERSRPCFMACRCHAPPALPLNTPKVNIEPSRTLPGRAFCGACLLHVMAGERPP